MAKRSKAYQDAAKKIEEGRFYSTAEAATLAVETAGAKKNSTVEVALKLGVDPRKADQMIRGTV
ncbi:MAG: 50S ribosomal protein L1, partial [Aquiluna sp.]